MIVQLHPTVLRVLSMVTLMFILQLRRRHLSKYFLLKVSNPGVLRGQLHRVPLVMGDLPKQIQQLPNIFIKSARYNHGSPQIHPFPSSPRQSPWRCISPEQHGIPWSPGASSSCPSPPSCGESSYRTPLNPRSPQRPWKHQGSKQRVRRATGLSSNRHVTKASSPIGLPLCSGWQLVHDRLRWLRPPLDLPAVWDLQGVGLAVGHGPVVPVQHALKV